jgi:hypothetical protein
MSLAATPCHGPRKEAHMRSMIVLMLAGMAALLSGCQFAGYYPNGRYSSSIYTDDIPPRKVYFPIVFKFPDDTMFFFPASEDPPHADLNLTAIGCYVQGDGALLVTAWVRNQGSAIVPAIPFMTGDLGAFRVAAVVRTAGGAQERLDVVQVVPMTVARTVSFVLGPTRTQASDVVGIDVVVDPDHVVPDPLRDNNVLSWRGTMQGAGPQCSVAR